MLNQPVTGCPRSHALRYQSYRLAFMRGHKLRPPLRITLWPMCRKGFVVLRKAKAEIHCGREEGKTCSDN